MVSPKPAAQGSTGRGRGRAGGKPAGYGPRGSEASVVGTPGQSRVFSLTQQEARDDPDVVSGTIFVAGFACSALFDSGASHSFMSEKFLSQLPRESAVLCSIPGLSVLLPTGNRLVASSVLVCEVEIDLLFFEFEQQ